MADFELDPAALKKAFAALKKQIEDSAYLQDFGDELSALADTLNDSTKSVQEKNAAFDQLADSVLKAKKEIQGFEQAATNFNNQLANTFQALTGVTDGSDTLAGSFFKTRKELSKLEKGSDKYNKALEAQIESIKEYVDNLDFAASAAGALQKNTKELLLANDNATSGFARATGMGKTFNKQILQIEKSNRRFGVTADDSASALQNLVEGLSGFGLMGAEVQSVLADEVAQLERLGVSASTTTGVFQSLTRTFGMNKEGVEKVTEEARVLAGELGISVNQAVEGLNKALPQLASLAADQVVPAFKELQEQSLETGIAVDGLIGIAGKFDTFEEAAKAAGNLNAVLGTQTFDTTALLEAQLEGPQAVTALLRDQLQSSVGSFEELTVFQRQAIANASGLNEQEVRGLFLSEEITEEQKKQADEREKNLKATMALKDELLALAREFAVAIQPLMDFAKFIVGGFAKAVRGIKSLPGMGGTTGSIVAGAGAIGGGMLLNKAKNKVSEKLFGKKVKADGTEKNPFFVRMMGGGDSGDSSAGDDGLLGKFKRKFKSKVTGKLLDGIGRLGFRAGREGPALPPGMGGGFTQGGVRGTIGNLASSMKGKLGGVLKGRLGGAGSFLKGGLSRLGGAGGFLKGKLGGALGKLGGGKLLAKLGSRAIPGLGQAMLAFDGVKFLGPKLLKGVKTLGPKLLGGVKKFGGAALGLLGKAGSGLKSFGGRAVKGLMRGIARSPIGMVGRGLGSAAKSVGRGLKKLKFWNEGTDATPSLSSNQVQIAGDGGPNAEPEMIVPPPKSAVINNANLMNALGGMAGGNPEMASAINNLGAKFDTLIGEVKNLNTRPVQVEATAVIGKKDFAKQVNGHFGRSGVSPATSAV